MRRSSWSRFVAVLLAGWLAVFSAELPGLAACDMHGASHASVAAASDEQAGDAHAGHHSSAPAQQDDGDSQQKDCCTCPSDCQSVSPALLASGSAGAIGATDLVSVGVPAPHSYLPTGVAHALPFANGPPTLS